MKTFFSTACLAPVLVLLASCGGMKKTASAPAGMQEFDQTTGTWKPATKIVMAPPHQESAPMPIATKAEAIPGQRSFWQKAGETAKKPLHWVGLGKDKTPPPPSPATTQTVAAELPPAPRSPIEPKPGHKSLWQRIGDAFKAPFNHGSSS
jgi:hypothetical protein